MGQQKLSKEQELKLVEEYRAGASVNQLMSKYGFANKKSITDKVKKHFPEQYEKIVEEAKINRKSYNYSLEKVKTEFDAYFLGLLLTDGYITDGIRVGIDLTDEDCIKFLSKSIGQEYKTYGPSSGSLNVQGKLNRHRLILSDRGLVQDLARLGVIPNKSSTLTGPNLEKDEEKFIPYIIRGIIDGDGCIFTTSYGAPAFYIINKSKTFCDWLVSVLTDKMFMKDICVNITKDGLYRIETANQSNILKLLVLSYNKPFGMSRKFLMLQKTFRDYNSDLLLNKEKGIVQTTICEKQSL